MRIISVRENPEFLEDIIKYFQKNWASEASRPVYDDCIKSCINNENPIPQWYVLEKDNEFIGCAGLITNDFISRMDLYPWLCALFIEKEHRGNNYAQLLIDRIKIDTYKSGFPSLYLCTDHNNYYEKFGFNHIGTGYHPWGENSKIYEYRFENSAEKVVKFLKDNNLTISTAESCTGGILSSSIVDIAGSSEVFLEGCITYSNKAKISRLNVTPETIEKYGAVSSQTSEEMAEGIALTSGTDIGISTTGIAGPSGGTSEKPVGLVWIGIYFKGNIKSYKYMFKGNRKSIRIETTHKAIELILQLLTE
jgi:PncC family amidohydrolase